MADNLDISLLPHSERYEDDDDRWRDQIADLVHELRVETDAVKVSRTPVPGTKGSLDQLVLTFGSAGVFTTAVDVLKIWLARDKTRSVELTYQDRQGKEQRLSVTAEHANDDALAPVIAAVAAQIQAAP
ncbi:MAG TPA: hypothetical protein VE442_07195 [Jatrophihabitans sp.]|jgi:UDP-N-acetylmuramate-alanine ligase|nr:hypothetical protein [Jatrophihabitans sp.]